MKFTARHITLLFLSGCLVAAAGTFFSCTKVINVNLNSASPQTVVEANISNQPGNYTVILSQTVNFSQPNNFPPITGALVIISDNTDNTDTLKESPPGTYTGSKLTGTPGRTYTLSITANGKKYSATSTMLPPVNIDSISYGKGPFGRDTSVKVKFQAPPSVINYFHLVEFINNVQQPTIFAYDDQYQLGQNVTFNLRTSSDSLKLNPTSDTVTVLLESTDEGVYNYYSSLMNANGGDFNASPANPTSNISNGALGYFSAYSITSPKTIIVP